MLLCSYFVPKMGLARDIVSHFKLLYRWFHEKLMEKLMEKLQLKEISPYVLDLFVCYRQPYGGPGHGFGCFWGPWTKGQA